MSLTMLSKASALCLTVSACSRCSGFSSVSSRSWVMPRMPFMEVRVFLPDARNRFDAIPTGRHAHIDESHGVRTLFLQGPLDQGQAFLALERRVEFENRMAGNRRRGVAKQGCFAFSHR